MIRRYAVLGPLCQALACHAGPSASIARVWDEEILSAIRVDVPNPPVHARNLFHFSVAVYDAWAAYDSTAEGYLYHAKQGASDIPAARREAISYAAYRLLTERYALSRNADKTLTTLAARMAALGYDPDNRTTDPSSPAGLGNRVAALVSAYYLEDGALQTRAYADWPGTQGGYASVNPPLLTQASGTLAVNPNRWQPLAITNAISQNNIPLDLIQKFLGAQWLGVRPWGGAREGWRKPWMDLGPPLHLGGAGDAQYRDEVVEVIRRSSQLTSEDGAVLDVSPGATGNNTLGANDGEGHALNPVTGLSYSQNLVKRGDFARVLAEFWADGPNSETPPGHWNVIANAVTDSASLSKRFGGTGPVVDDLEWDVKLYFALNAALHDAACAAWSLKRYYDGWRPIEAVRYQGQRGQSSIAADATYDPNGLSLEPGLIEIVTSASAQPGGRHAGLPVGAIAVYTWPGQPAHPDVEQSGCRWIQAKDWVPYQKNTFVTPAFPGYVSGHSTFSRAAAEVLTAVTGSPFFPDGLGTFIAPAHAFLAVENGPSQTVQLQWGTYFDAADQAGLSRLWGGIHVSADDLTGRRLGAECGRRSWALARQYFDGSIAKTPFNLSMRALPAGGCELRWEALRGFVYQLQSTPDLVQPWTDDPAGTIQAIDTSVSQIGGAAGPSRFYRLLRSPDTRAVSSGL